MSLVITAFIVAGLTGLPAAGAGAPDTDAGAVRMQAKRDAAMDRRLRKLGPQVMLCRFETRPSGMRDRTCLTRAAWDQKSWEAQADLREIVRRGSQSGD